jgi:hypothetical protein
METGWQHPATASNLAESVNALTGRWRVIPPMLQELETTSHLKKWILVPDRGGGEIQTGGILQYAEVLNFTSNKENPYFEMACKEDGFERASSSDQLILATSGDDVSAVSERGDPKPGTTAVNPNVV